MRRLIAVLALVIGCAWGAPANAGPPVHFKTHKVKAGDTLSKLAKKYRVNVSDLIKLNNLSKKRFIFPGQRLKIRPDRRSLRRAAIGHKKMGRRKLTTSQRRTRLTGRWTTYKVKKGDTLWRIADRFDVSPKTLISANKLGNAPHIFPGDTLRVRQRGTHILKGGVALPRRGPGYRAMRPTRSYGTPGAIRLIEKVYAQFHALHPNSVPGVIADISKKHGGFLPPHKSHQRGVDADISYYKKNNKRMRGLETVTPETIDLVKTWDLMRLFINTGHIKAIFMDYKLQAALHTHLLKVGYDQKLLTKVLQYPRTKSKRRGIVRHSRGHHHHLHIRFDCVRVSDACEPTNKPLIAKRLIPAASTNTRLAETKNATNNNGRNTRQPLELNIDSILNTPIAPVVPAQTSAEMNVMRRPAAGENRQKPSAVSLVAARSAATARRSAARTIELEPPDWFAAFRFGPNGRKKVAAQFNQPSAPARAAERPTRMSRFGPQDRRQKNR